MGYRAKLQLAFLTLGLAAIGLTGWVASAGAATALRKATYDRLTAIRQDRVRQIERWFQDLGNHTLALATDEATITALEGFSRSWAQVPAADDAVLRGYYEQAAAPSTWFPRDPRVRALQHRFIAANPHPIGHKDRLLEGPGAYGSFHARYHPTLQRYQSAFGFYDVLLIDANQSRVVYSVVKEFDLGVPLGEEPYRDTALARIYRRAMQIQEPEQFVLQDYEFYVPSRSAPAAFLAAPVWRGGLKAGVLAIQVSAEELNRMMTSERLGQSGRISIVGPDGTLRSGNSILRERTAKFRRDTEETEMTHDLHGRERLCSHARLRVPGVDWALMVEIDAEEALAPVRTVQMRILAIGSLIAGAFLIAAALLARSVTEPVLALARAAQRLGKRDFSFRLPAGRGDEIGQLAGSFNRMAEDLERTTVHKSELEALAGRLITAQEDERQRVARELHDDITQRLAAIAIEAGTLGQSSDAGRLRQGLERVKRQMAELSRDIHGLSRRLHPKLLDDLGLVAAIEAECRALFERGGPVAEFTPLGDWTGVSKPVALALFRVVQESLRNVEKHAGAETVSIRLQRDNSSAHLIVQDDGRGFAARKPGLGLASMEERARSLAGRLCVESQPGEGTKVEVWLPLDAETHSVTRG
jgi:methyl-accepting chemotaxis protein